jgi:hypothetical protein
LINRTLTVIYYFSLSTLKKRENKITQTHFPSKVQPTGSNTENSTGSNTENSTGSNTENGTGSNTENGKYTSFSDQRHNGKSLFSALNNNVCLAMKV